MPCFFFDVGEGRECVRDNIGICLRSIGDVPDETQALLEQLGFDAASAGMSCAITVIVRDEANASVYVGSVLVEVTLADE